MDNTNKTQKYDQNTGEQETQNKCKHSNMGNTRNTGEWGKTRNTGNLVTQEKQEYGTQKYTRD